MNRGVLAVAAVVALVIVAGAFVLPDGPAAAGAGDASGDGNGDGTAGGGGGGNETSDGGSGGGGPTPVVTVSGASGTATTEQPFAFAIDEIEQCGSTCRDVTSTVTNQQSSEATGVDVTTDIYAGNGTGGDTIWSGEESVGALPAGESYTATKRVELGMSDALAVEQNDGWITIETTIESDSKTMTITQRRDVN
jgi:hypothetical protein